MESDTSRESDRSSESEHEWAKERMRIRGDAIDLLDRLTATLLSLAESQVKWDHNQLRIRWLEAARLFRELDRPLAIQVDSYDVTDAETIAALLVEGEPCSGGEIARSLDDCGYVVVMGT